MENIFEKRAFEIILILHRGPSTQNSNSCEQFHEMFCFIFPDIFSYFFVYEIRK